MRFWKRWSAEPEPQLSVVVPVHQVEKFLDACLTSLRAQDVQRIEILVVDDGSTDGSAAIARRHAKRDRRVRIITQANAGLSAARNAGIEQARGRYLTMVDSDDTVTEHAFRAAIDSLDASGADYAMLPYRQTKASGPLPVPPWIADLYAPGPRTVARGEDLGLLVQATAWSKVYRREFFDTAGLRFREGALYEDQEVSAAAYAAAEAIDLVPVECYHWRLRSGSITREATGRSIHHFFEAVDRSLIALDPIPGAASERARQLLANDAPRYLRSLAGNTDPTFARNLFAGVARLLPLVGREALARETPAEAKVMYALIAAGEATKVAEFIAADGVTLASHRFTMLPEGPALEFPFFSDETIDRSAFVLSERQTPADARVLRVQVDEDGADVDVLAHLRHLDEGESTARAWLVDNHDEVVSTLLPQQVPGLVGHRVRTTRASNESCVWRMRFAWPTAPASELRLRMEVSHHGRTDSVDVDLVDEQGSAAWPQQGGGWSWEGTEPARWRLARIKVPSGGAASEVDRDDQRVRVHGTWVELPREAGSHTIADSCTAPLARTLPIDLADGWLGLNPERALVWTVLRADRREQATVWWQRDLSGPR